MTHGIYRAQIDMITDDSKVIIKYQVGTSAADAEERAVRFDDPCWRNAEFKLVEATLEPFDERHQQNHMILVSRLRSELPRARKRR